MYLLGVINLKKKLLIIGFLLILLTLAGCVSHSLSFISGQIWISAGMKPTIYHDQEVVDYWHNIEYNPLGIASYNYVVPTSKENIFLSILDNYTICEMRVDNNQWEVRSIYESDTIIMSPQYLRGGKGFSYITYDEDYQLRLCVLSETGQKYECGVILTDSGYHWLNDNEVLISCKTGINQSNIARYNIITHELNTVFEGGNYLSLSSNEKYLTYVDKKNMCSVILVNMQNGKTNKVLIPDNYEGGASRPTNDGRYIVISVCKTQANKENEKSLYSDVLIIRVEDNKVQSLLYPYGVIDSIHIDQM